MSEEEALWISFHKERNGQAGIVLGMATGTCFVDNMCMPRNEIAAVVGLCVVAGQ